MSTRSTSEESARAAGGPGRYRVLRHLGQGGMGTLSLASDPAGRTVVIKRPLPGRITPQALALARREAAIASSLDHPGIVRVLDVVDDDGVPVLVMEHLVGLTLQEVEKRSRRSGGIPLEPLLDAIAQAARALHYLHTRTDDEGRPRGLVHRDVSPDNLFVLADGTTKLLDFGVARADDLDELTRVGGLRGKRGYFAPELIQGHTADPRSDLFALGVTAYGLFCRRLPWGRLDPGPAFVAMQGRAPATPSSVNRFLPAAVDEVVMGMLAVDRADRFASGDEVATLIESLLERVPQGIRTPARLVDRFADVDEEATAVGVELDVLAEASPDPDARLDPTRPAQRWDERGASGHEDEESSAAMSRPTGSLRAQPTLQILGVLDAAPRLSPGQPTTSAPLRLPLVTRTGTFDHAPGFGTAPPTNASSPSLSRSRRSDSPPRASSRGRTVGVVVGLAIGAIVLVGVALHFSTPMPPSTLVAATPPARSGVPPTAPFPTPLAAAVPAPTAAPTAAPTPAPTSTPTPVPTAPAVVVEVPIDEPATGPRVDVTPKPGRRTTRVSVRGPARIQWLVAGRVAKTGAGAVDLPVGARSLQARDPRRGVTSTVPLEDDVADYDALPRATLLLRARPWALVHLGEESLGQTPLQPLDVVAGRYTVRFTRPGKVVTRSVDVGANAGTVKVNVDMEADGAD